VGSVRRVVYGFVGGGGGGGGGGEQINSRGGRGSV